MIPVTKPYLPSFEKYQKYLQGVYERNWLTNNGPLLRELTERLKDYFGVKYLLPVANGTLALQIAYRALRVKGSAVTTPYTFVATSSSLHWEGIEPVFADIEKESLNLSPILAEQVIRPDTSAIVPVHVYGNPCKVDQFEQIAERHGLKVIYDAAHAFGVRISETNILNYGDASTLSFHATKVFHTVEGGAVVFKDADAYEKARSLISFGMDPETGEILGEGINAKLSEVHAAMGMAVLDDIQEILAKRQQLVEVYRQQLSEVLEMPRWLESASQNGAYAPVLFKSRHQRQQVFDVLRSKHILTRPYFSPALQDTISYADCGQAPIAQNISERVLCLPLYYDLDERDARRISQIIKDNLR